MSALIYSNLWGRP